MARGGEERKADPPRRKKVFHSKARTGCKTCRARKVKCDEEKPTCARCARTGWKCEGYEITLKVSAEDQLTYTLNPTGNFLESYQDAQAFQYYLSAVTSRLQSVSFSPLWDRSIPQARHESAAVNHALLAVAARQCAREAHPDQIKQMRQLAVMHYCKAMRQVAEGGHSLDMLLLCCLLFVVYENMGYWRELTHARSGLRLFKEYRGGKLPDLEVKSLSLLNEELAPMFEDRVAKLVGVIEKSETEQSKKASTKLRPTIPTFYTSVLNAHTVLSGLVVLVLDKILELEEQYPTGFKVSIIQESLDKWRNAFQRFCDKAAPGNDFYRDYRKLLWIHHRILHVMLGAAESGTEMAFDKHREDFEYILAKSIQVNASQMKPPTGLGLVAPLYLVATRCRDPVLRRKAVAQLHAKAHQSNMMLLACPTADLANHIIRLEEQSLTTVRSSDDIVEGRRVKTLRVCFSPLRKSIEVELRWWKSGDASHRVEKHLLPMSDCGTPNCASSLTPEVIIPNVDPSIMRIINGYISQA